jgi:hypothetical protein
MMNRREFLAGIAAAAALEGCADEPPPRPGGAAAFAVRTLTSGPRHHFFGDYGIPPWNRSQSKLVCLESTFQDHLPGETEAARIGLVDPASGAFQAVAETRAWNFLQGAMIHWNPLEPESEILFNDRKDGDIVTRVLNLKTGRENRFPGAIAGVSGTGRHALCLNFGRLARLRSVMGYAGAKDPNPGPNPENDGIWLMDLETGQTRLVVSGADIHRRLLKDHPEIADRSLFLNHPVFNRTGTRFLFLARTFTPEKRLETGMFTANRDGTDLREVIAYGSGVSHSDWRDDIQILATFRFGGDEIKHVLFSDGLRDYRAVGEGFLKDDGHCSFAPDGRWIVTDRIDPDTREKSLMVYDVEARRGVVIGRFPPGDDPAGDLCCNLHPRWSRTGHAISFDAIAADGTRQLHLATKL